MRRSIATFLLAVPPALALPGLGGCQASVLASARVGQASFTIARTAATPPTLGTAVVTASTAAASPHARATPALATTGAISARRDEAVRGQVFGEAGGQDTPLPGALVQTSDGRSATTAADGSFTLAGGSPADGLYLASCPGYAPSAVAGLTDTAIALHLQALTAAVPAPSQAPNATITVSGRVENDQGQPLGGMVVMLADSRGSAGNPSVSAADGSFSVTLVAPGQSLLNGTLLAADPRGQWLAMAVNLQGSGPTLTLAPLRAVPTTHTLAVQADASAVGAPAHAALALVAPDGTALSLFQNGGAYRVAAIAGARYDLRADAADPLGTFASSLEQQDLAIDDTTASSTVTAPLLAPPRFVGTPSVQPGSTLGWSRVPGADGYTLTLSDASSGAFLWQAFTADCAIAVASRVASQGRFGLTLTAWDAPALTARSVSDVGPRALRVLPLAGSYREAWRHETLTF